MLISDVLRPGLMATLAATVILGHVEMPALYVLALAFGIVSGFLTG